LLADAYTAQRDLFQARATLNSIIDNKFPVPEIVEGARQRLKGIPAGTEDEPAPASKPATPAKAAPAKTAPAKPAAPAKSAAPAKTPARKPTR
jgi:hypothetical protein